MLPRFTDFLVFEVDQDYKVLHLTSIEKPDGLSKPVQKKKDHNVSAQSTTGINRTTAEASESGENTITPTLNPIPIAVSTDSVPPVSAKSGVSSASSAKEGTWTDHITETLTPLLSSSAIVQLREMFLQGPEPPLVPDSGWGGRRPSVLLENDTVADNTEGGAPTPIEIPSTSSHAREREGRGGRGGRGAKGDRGRGRGRGGRSDNDSTRPGKREDLRKVVSDVSTLHLNAVHHLLAYPHALMNLSY